MVFLSSETIAVLEEQFAKAPEYTLSVADLEALLPANECEQHLSRLTSLHFIEVSDTADPTISREHGFPVFHTGAPTAYRLTYEGKVFLATREEEKNYRAQQDARQSENEKRAVQQRIEDRRYSRNTAIIAAALSSLFTLLIEHFDELVVWAKVLLGLG